MKTPEEKAKEILDALAKQHGDETFVADGYGYYMEAQDAIAEAIREVGQLTYSALTTPLSAFGGLAPLEYVRQGDAERINYVLGTLLRMGVLSRPVAESLHGK